MTTLGGSSILLDCGASPRPARLGHWEPGPALAVRGIRLLRELIVSHADEDHLQGLASLAQSRVDIGWVETNDTLSPETIRSLKDEQPGEPLERFLELLHRQRTQILSGMPPTQPRHDIWVYKYRVPYSALGTVQDLNNLSLVTFLSAGGLNLVFPGDIEQKAWEILLENRNFRYLLSRVNVFVAPHHGRRNGYFGEVFDYCSPDIVVFSDSAIQHDTQETAHLYGRRAMGMLFDDGRRRRVVTTRNNGGITLEATPDGYRAFLQRA